MSTATAIDELTRALGGDAVSVEPAALLTASRDHAWLSPILTAALPSRLADVVVRPTVATLPAVLDIAHHHRIPVTPRGRGTGNYGQAVPLAGGIVVDLTGCDAVRAVDGDVADVEAGVTFGQLEQAARPHDLEVAVMPSTVASTVGGFLSGGNQGIGSIAHGSIWDGWVSELDVVGCTTASAPFTVRGAAVERHLHAYGTAGILAAARLRLAPRQERTVLWAAFDDVPAAAHAGRALMDLDPVPRVLAVDDAALARTLPPHRGVVADRTVLRAALALETVAAATAIVGDHGGRVTATDAGALPSLYASVYNHATLRAKRVDPDVVALQVRGAAIVDRLPEVRAALPDVRLHLDGNAPAQHGKGWSGLLLSRWVDADVLAAGAARLRDLGIGVISPHTWVLGGHGNAVRLRPDRGRTYDHDPDEDDVVRATGGSGWRPRAPRTGPASRSRRRCRPGPS